ncbi:hypothetical protein [Actinomadura oligospora]|uniref:hypothetical protein n=1 Tax=Actinomadura oligospora TaxID=111804 RepID=UPI000687C1B9|nr:hypothetical protein [Actinomadura oligospora]
MTPWISEQQLEVPEVYVSVSFPTTGARSGKTIGQCHYSSKDGRPHLLVHPYLDDPIDVLETLLHELVHAVVGGGVGHSGPFATLAKALGFEAPMTSTPASPELKWALRRVATRGLGLYPHAALQRVLPKQTTRQRKIVCPNLDCPAYDIEKGTPYLVRMSKRKFDQWGAICGACASSMEMEELA